MPDHKKEAFELPDFKNTAIAYSHKSDLELQKAALLFKMMNSPLITKVGTSLTLAFMKLRFPFTKTIIKKTIFEQFCGGETLLDCQPAIDKLRDFGALTILDYGAESKSSPEELDQVMEETIRAIELAASNSSVPVVSTKITGLVDNDILIKLDAGEELNDREQEEYELLHGRLEKVFSTAANLGVGVMVDAEESWMQEAIDELVEKYMAKYNKEKAIVYNTYQLYRHDKLAQMKEDHQKALAGSYYFAAKLVRGAYMEKERERAEELGYESPIHINKAAVDKDYNDGLRYCIENYESIASCCASHNEESNLLQAKLIAEKGIERTHPHLNFCQLYGMGDNLSFNIASLGYNVAKYVPYGPVDDVVPYLIRRANENTSVAGEASRELKLIMSELKRRKKH